MINRTPPSLNWLVNKRSCIHGEAIRMKRKVF